MHARSPSAPLRAGPPLANPTTPSALRGPRRASVRDDAVKKKGDEAQNKKRGRKPRLLEPKAQSPPYGNLCASPGIVFIRSL